MMTLMKKFKKLLNKSILKFNKIYIVNRVRLFYGKLRSRKNIKFISLILFNIFIKLNNCFNIK